MKIYVILIVLLSAATAGFGQKIIVNWTDSSAVTPENPRDMDSRIIGGTLRVHPHAGGNISFTIPVAGAGQDVSGFSSIVIPVANLGNIPCTVDAYLGNKGWIGGEVILSPGQKDQLEILFIQRPDSATAYFKNMEGLPGGFTSIWDPIDPSKLSSLRIRIKAPAPVTVALSSIAAEDTFHTGQEMAEQPGFFPFVDEFGQYEHDDWPGKTHAVAELSAELQAEKKELSLLATPEAFDRFGGWKDGPLLKATGMFRVEKVKGKWWMVDPDGRLFWSHGVNCVGFGSGSTPVTGRESYFSPLPDSTGIFASAYQFRHGEKSFNFYVANLIRKYGADWKGPATTQLLERLRSWGMNSIGNWSDPAVYLSATQRVAYTAGVSYSAPAIDGGEFKFPDVFDPLFEERLQAAVKRVVAQTGQDPWCIGYFVDNELKVLDLAKAAMRQKANGPAKLALVSWLKKKYGLIGRLNVAYQTRYTSWDAVLQENVVPPRAAKDFALFDEVIADRYYAACSKALREAAPGKLYLGSRFNLYRIYYPDDTSVSRVMRIAARYCDIVSINYYRYGCDNLHLPSGVDKPILIGEFHFGAMDRGLAHTGLRNVATQQQRGTMYRSYLQQALQNPQIVGAHWFQYGDEPFAGRSDGENYQIGFVDVCDRPYPETVEAIREIGYHLYEMRSDQGGVDR